MDILRIVKFPYRGARPITVLDINTSTYENVRDTFKVEAAAKNQQFSESQMAWGGANLAGQSHGNGTVSAETYIQGASKDASKQAMEDLLKNLETLPSTQKHYLEWRPDGSTYSAFFEIRGALPYEPMYRWVEFAGIEVLHLKWTLSVAPGAEGMPMYGHERFDSVNDGSTLGDYSFPAGPSSDLALAGSAPYTLNSSANHTVQKLLIENLRSYTSSEWSAQLAFKPYPVSSTFSAGVILKYIDASNYLAVEVYDVAGTLYGAVVERVDGVSTRYGATLITAGNADPLVLEAVVNGDCVGWTVGRSLRSDVETAGRPANILSLFGSDSSSMASITTVRNQAINSAVLGEGVAGKVGLMWTPNGGTAKLYEWCYCANTFSYLARSSTAYGTRVPRQLNGGSSIPGTAPAKVDLYVSNNGVGAATQGILGWLNDPGVFSFVWNGDFEQNNADGWSAAAQTGLTAAATSVGSSTGLGDNPAGSYVGVGQLTTSDDSGVKFPVYGEFKRGEVYTVRADVKCHTGTPNGAVGVGVSGSNYAESAATALNNTTYTNISATWTVVDDSNVAWVYIKQTDAGVANLFYFDRVQLYKGSTAPTTAAQLGGRGAYPPFGDIPAAAASNKTGVSVYAEGAAAKYSDILRTATSSTPGSSTAAWWVDPSLCQADDFGGESIRVEVWAYISDIDSAVTPRVVLSAISGEGGSLTTGSTRYTEFGTAGVSITAGFQRIGTLSLPVANPNESGRWKIKLETKWGTGSSGNIDLRYLTLVPAERRQASPTGITVDSSYPTFNPVAAAGKLLTSDGRGFLHQPAAGLDSLYPDHGLGGAPLSLTPGVKPALVNTLIVSGAPETASRVQFLVTPRFHMMRGS